jgi:hypothetical protein
MVSPHSVSVWRAIDAGDAQPEGGMYPAPTSGVVIEYTTHRYGVATAPPRISEYGDTIRTQARSQGIDVVGCAISPAVSPMVSPHSVSVWRAIDAGDVQPAGGMYPAPTSGVVIEYTTHRYSTVSPQHPQEYRNTGTPSERRQDHRASMYSVAPSQRQSLPWCPRIP